MSHFAFGTILIEGPAEPSRETIEWAIIEVSVAARVYVNLDWNIVQEDVHEMLGTRDGESNASSIAFLVTGGPCENTSEEFIFPSSGGDSFVHDLARGLIRLQQWVTNVLQINGVREIELWLTEGSDLKFREVSMAAGQLAEHLREAILAESFVPSIRIRLRK